MLRRRDRGGTSSLRTILQRAIVLTAVLATLLFATPLAIAVNGLYRSQTYGELARDAERLRSSLADPTGRMPATERIASVRIGQPPDTDIGVYAADGRLVAGRGPATGDPIVREVARSGIEAEDLSGGSLVSVVPVPDATGRATLLIRAARAYAEVQNRTFATWAVMAALAAVVLAVVTALARARAGQVARPLQELATAADQLGRGDFSVRAVRSGVAEVDAVSTNLERTARRLGGMLERERAFSSDASHQLRTPLTAVRIGLESALLTPGADLHAAAESALEGLDRLEQTVLDLLALARDTAGVGSVTDVATVVTEAAAPWCTTLQDAGRRLVVEAPRDLPAAAVSPQALRTVLDVLLGNALVHGAGGVRVCLDDTAETVLVTVVDEGPGVATDPEAIFRRRSAEARGTGIGLSLARSLVEAEGGRLVLARARPATFSVLLPVAAPLPEPGRPEPGRPEPGRPEPGREVQRSGAS